MRTGYIDPDDLLRHGHEAQGAAFPWVYVFVDDVNPDYKQQHRDLKREGE